MKRRAFLTAASEALTYAGAAGVTGTAHAAGTVAAAGPAAAASGRVAETEAPIDPDWPIIDAHHHLWDYPARGGAPPSRYLLDDLLADINASGHRITHTVFIECMTTYRAAGPADLRSLGETEFVNGIAAMSASGNYGPCRVADGIVAFVDLRLGDAVEPLLEAHRASAGARLKGVRNSAAWDSYPVMGIELNRERLEWLTGPRFHTGVARLAAHDLAFETWVFHTQLPQVTALASAVPQASIVLGHVGTPIGVGPYRADPRATFDHWKRDLLDLAKRPNVFVKLGGLGMAFVSPELAARKPAAGSAEIAEAWRPYIETCIEAFGPQRCMFESNFPPDGASCSYGTLWNVFKRLTQSYSRDERTALFSGTAARVFRLTA
jgi:predicted TIM-barrel fold metal-dependent hydrolase